jgi:hypothetical protein
MSGRCVPRPSPPSSGVAAPAVTRLGGDGPAMRVNRADAEREVPRRQGCHAGRCASGHRCAPRPAAGPRVERAAPLPDPIRHPALARRIVAQPDRVRRGFLDQGYPDRRCPAELARKPGGQLADRDVGCVKDQAGNLHLNQRPARQTPPRQSTASHVAQRQEEGRRAYGYTQILQPPGCRSVMHLSGANRCHTAGASAVSLATVAFSQEIATSRGERETRVLRKIL